MARRTEDYFVPSTNRGKTLYCGQVTEEEAELGLGAPGTWWYEWKGRNDCSGFATEAEMREAAMAEARSTWPDIRPRQAGDCGYAEVEVTNIGDR